jgi:hypothetical protein
MIGDEFLHHLWNNTLSAMGAQIESHRKPLQSRADAETHRLQNARRQRAEILPALSRRR